MLSLDQTTIDVVLSEVDMYVKPAPDLSLHVDDHVAKVREPHLPLGSDEAASLSSLESSLCPCLSGPFAPAMFFAMISQY